MAKATAIARAARNGCISASFHPVCWQNPQAKAFTDVSHPAVGFPNAPLQLAIKRFVVEVLARAVDSGERVPAVERRSHGRIQLLGGSVVAGEHRLAALIVDPGQFDMGPPLLARLGPLADHVHDPAADPAFQQLLDRPGMKALLAPRMTTHGVTTVRAYCEDMLRYTDADTANQITCPTFVTDNEADVVSTGQGQMHTTTSPVRNSSAYSLRPKAPKDTAKVWRRPSSGTPPTTGSAPP